MTVTTKKRLHVFWSGRVQGVGFRFTAEEVAESLGLVGWVANLHDGRVEAVLEGPEATLQDFLDGMQRGPMGAFIHHVDASWSSATGEFRRFDVRYF